MKENDGLGGYAKLTSFKSSHLKVSLAIGGPNNSSSFSTVSANQGRRKKFIQNIIEYLQKYNFDGCDLDWEFPNRDDEHPEDRTNFSMLVKEMSAAFKEKGLLLTAAIGAEPKIIEDSYEIDVISKHLDYLHVMCFDYHGPWDDNMGPNAPLHSHDSHNVTATLDNLLKKGAPSHKLVMGLPFFGTFFENSYGGFGPDEDIETGGVINYNAIVAGKWEKAFDEECAEMYARKIDCESSPRKVIVFDDTRSIALKVNCGMQYDLAGFMVWSLDMDILRDNGNPGAKNFPLLRALNEAIGL